MIFLDFDVLAEEEERFKEAQSQFLQHLHIAVVGICFPFRLQDDLLDFDAGGQRGPVCVFAVDQPQLASRVQVLVEVRVLYFVLLEEGERQVAESNVFVDLAVVTDQDEWVVQKNIVKFHSFVLLQRDEQFQHAF
jgi:hypothetical protein